MTFPARPMVVGATNPCPCGRSRVDGGGCGCTPDRVRAYRSRISGPLVDRIDIHVPLASVDVMALQALAPGEASCDVRVRIERARRMQRDRFESGDTTVLVNAQLPQGQLEKVCALDRAAKRTLAGFVEKHDLSARAYAKVLRVARTIADLDGLTALKEAHVAEAVATRVFDRAAA